MSAEAVKPYEEVEDSIDEYPEDLRKDFEELSKKAKNMPAVLQYKKQYRQLSSIFWNTDRLVENLMLHEFTKDKLMSLLLQNSTDDLDTKKEI